MYTCKCAPGFTGNECQIEISDCATNPCQNSGTCLELSHGYKCECHKGFIGKHCEEKTVTCADKPCIHGTCRDTTVGFKCECPLNYSGLYCETQINECNPNPCQNGGTCVQKDGTYKCMCPSGFKGTRCDENIDDCNGNPCQNGGTCVDMVNQFRCQCVPGFIGSVCENKVDLCRTKPCANGGTCHNLKNEFRCDCRPGFMGKDCSIDIDECASHPCKNGGSCVNRVNKFQCICPGGFIGKTCEQEGQTAAFDSGSSRHFAITQDGRPADDGLSSGQIALIVIFSILMPLIAFIAAAVVICMKKKRKREQEKDDAEARKQNEQNASHISRINHNSIKRNPNLTSDMAPHVIKNTWDKSVNNITNSQSLDDCLMNSTLYGGVSMYSSDNTIASDTCFQAVPTNKSTDMQRAKSQKQLNTDPMKVHRASQIITPPPPTAVGNKTDGIYDMKRISLLSDAALCNTRWIPSPAPISNSRPILVGGGVGTTLPQCSPPHM